MTERVKKWIGFSVLIFLSIILVSEILLRIVYHDKLKTRVYPLIYQPDSILGYRYIPNIHGEIDIPGVHKKFTINSNGFYGPDFSKEKSKGKYRIAILGDSESCGIWLNGRNDFSILLQHLFDKKHINAEVLNFSMDGRMRDLNNINLIQEVVMKYSPDLVLLNTHIPFVENHSERAVYKDYVFMYNADNDLSRKWCKAKIDYIEDNKLPIFIYNVSYIARLFCRRYANKYRNSNSLNLNIFITKRVQAPDIQFIPYSTKRTLEILKSTKDNLKGINCNLALFSYTNFDSVFNSYGTKIGLQTLFLNVPDDKQLVNVDDGHFNEKGQQLIAQSIYDKIVNQNAIISLYK